MKANILVAAVAAMTFATPVLAESAAVVVPPSVQAPRVAPPDARAPVVAVPAVPVPTAPCFYQGRAFSNGSANPMGETCDKGTWR